VIGLMGVAAPGGVAIAGAGRTVRKTPRTGGGPEAAQVRTIHLEAIGVAPTFRSPRQSTTIHG